MVDRLDKQYKITDQFDDDYGLGDFIEEMMKRGYIENNDDNTQVVITKKPKEAYEKNLWRIFLNHLIKVVLEDTKLNIRVVVLRDNQKQEGGIKMMTSDN